MKKVGVEEEMCIFFIVGQERINKWDSQNPRVPYQSFDSRNSNPLDSATDP